jgi:hypothetical protein
MKLKIYTITTLFILLSATFSQTVFAQTAKKQAKVLTQDELDKREVKRFVDKFMSSFEEKKDLRLIPRKFFANNFKLNLTKSYKKLFFDGMKEDETKVFNQISNDEFYQWLMLVINFSQLNIMINDGICCEDYSGLFPSKVLKQFDKQETDSALLLAKHMDNDDIQMKSVKQFYVAMSNMKKINYAQLRYIKSCKSDWKTKYKINIAATRKHFESYRSFLCSDDDCDNQEQGTLIFYTAAFPYILNIQKKKKNYKISNIFPYTN